MEPAAPRPQRRLAAILAADVAGFSALMSKDEEGTHRQIKALEREVIAPTVQDHHGRIVKTTGDGFLIEFGSPVEAVRCALTIQKKLTEGALQLRIGINLGDVIVEGDGDVYGEGVNVAARLEALCDPGGILVSGKVYDEVEGKVQAAFESRGEQQVKNIARTVRVFALRCGLETSAEAPKPLPPPDKPSIAVLPFTNMSGDPEQEYFADGITEDIITALSKWRWLFVIARNSSFTFKGKAVAAHDVGRDLGVRYVLEGSIRRAANRVRITTHLVESATGIQVWSDRYDRALEDIFALQDEITSTVVTTLEPRLTAAEVSRAHRKPPDSLTAYDYYLRALSELYRIEAASFRRADELLTKALAIDPNYADALAISAYCAVRSAMAGWDDWERARAKAGGLVRRAIMADPDHGAALATAAWVYSIAEGHHDTASELAHRALRLHPNSAYVRGQCGWVFLYGGEVETAAEHFEVGLRLNPLDPRAMILLAGIAAARFFARRFEECVEWSRRTIRDNPGHSVAMRYLASALAHLGRFEEAAAVVGDILEVQPNSSLSRSRGSSPFRQEWMLSLYVDGLQLAGLPE